MNAVPSKKLQPESLAGDPVDVVKLMKTIRQRVETTLSSEGDSGLRFRSKDAVFSSENARRAGALLHSEELRYLNQNYAYGRRLSLDGIQSHRAGVVGNLIVRVKRKLVSILWESLLRDYFEREREYQASLVRFLNDMTRYVDERDAANFWELIRKIDVDVTRAVERTEQLHDEAMATLRSSEKRLVQQSESSVSDLRTAIATLQADLRSSHAEVQTLESVSRGLEAIVSRQSSETAPAAAAATVMAPQPSDQRYVLLENRFRGSEEEIASRMEFYLPYLRALPGPVLEVGCGRGELLSLLAAKGIEAHGVDMDPAMVERATEKGLRVTCGDGIRSLRELPSNSLGAVIAVQVVEHLEFSELRELIHLSIDRVSSGGRIIFETINPRSLVALSSNYFRDPTHVAPLHPDTLQYLFTLEGAPKASIEFLSPFPEEEKLSELAMEAYFPPRWRSVVQNINENIRKLNGLFYAHQDFCIIAEVP